MRHVIDLCHEGVPAGHLRHWIAAADFGDGNRAYVSTPNYLRKGRHLRGSGRQAGMEIIRTGNLSFVKQMIKEDCWSLRR